MGELTKLSRASYGQRLEPIRVVNDERDQLDNREGDCCFWENFFRKAANCQASESVERIYRQ